LLAEICFTGRLRNPLPAEFCSRPRLGTPLRERPLLHIAVGCPPRIGIDFVSGGLWHRAPAFPTASGTASFPQPGRTSSSSGSGRAYVPPSLAGLAVRLAACLRASRMPHDQRVRRVESGYVQHACGLMAAMPGLRVGVAALACLSACHGRSLGSDGRRTRRQRAA